MERRVITDVFAVFWSAGKSGAPSLSAMKESLIANNFNEECALEVPMTTAFRRVLADKEGKSPDGSEIRACFKENGRLRGQLDRLYMPPGSDRIEHEPIAGWIMDKDGSIDNSLGHEDIGPSVAAAKLQYTWADVTGVLKRVFERHGNGAFMMRPGVYCIPTRNAADLLDRLENVAQRIGLHLTCCTIPDTGSGRAEVTNAIVSAFQAECDEHQKSVESYSAEKSKVGVVENRKEAIKQTRANIEKLTAYLGEQAQPLLARLQELDQRADAAIVAINNFKPVAKGRRVVTTGE